LLRIKISPLCMIMSCRTTLLTFAVARGVQKQCIRVEVALLSNADSNADTDDLCVEVMLLGNPEMICVLKSCYSVTRR